MQIKNSPKYSIPSHIVFNKIPTPEKNRLIESYAYIYNTFEAGLILIKKEYFEVLNKISQNKNINAKEQEIIEELASAEVIVEDDSTKEFKPYFDEIKEFDLWVQGVNFCNLSCLGCSTGMDIKKENQRKIEIDEAPFFFNKIFKDAKAKSFEKCTVKLGGGEPTLAGTEWIDQISKIIRQTAKKYQIEVRIVLLTNGLALTDRVIHVMKEKNLNFVVSLDPARTIPGTNVKTIGAVLKNIKKLKDAGLIGCAQYTIYPENINEVLNLYNEMCALEVPISWAIFRPQSQDQLKFCNAEKIINGIKPLFDQISQNIIENKFHGTLSKFDYLDLTEVRQNGCKAGRNYLILDGYGNIYSCHGKIGSENSNINCKDKINLFDFIKENFDAKDFINTDKIKGDGIFDYQAGKGCHYVREIENGGFSVSSRNIQKIYEYSGKRMLDLMSLKASM